MKTEEAIKQLRMLHLVTEDPEDKAAILKAIQVLKHNTTTLGVKVVAQKIKTAKWIPVRFGDCKCSLCGETYGIIGMLLGSYNYCPNCGAKMQKEENNNASSEY